MQDDIEIPARARSIGKSPVFSADTVPPALQERHQIADDAWGRLSILEGSLVFVDLRGADAEDRGRETAEQPLAAGDTLVIRPACPHRVRIRGPVRFQLEFFRE